MVKHVILWQFKDEYSQEAKKAMAEEIKLGLENLRGKIPGLIGIHVQTGCLPSSNADVMLDSSFDDEEALRGYAVHPEHVKVADTKVRPYMKTRICMDFEQ